MSMTEQFPEHQFGWKILGIILGQTGRKPEAINAKQRAVQLAPQDAEAHNNLGITLQELGRFEEAEVQLPASDGVETGLCRSPLATWVMRSMGLG